MHSDRGGRGLPQKNSKEQKDNPQYVAGPGVNTEELKNRYSQIQSAICECIKNNQS